MTCHIYFVPTVIAYIEPIAATTHDVTPAVFYRVGSSSDWGSNCVSWAKEVIINNHLKSLTERQKVVYDHVHSVIGNAFEWLAMSLAVSDLLAVISWAHAMSNCIV